MKKVYLIGDSIRLSYQPKVAELLGENWLVDGPKVNSMFSGYTLRMAPDWLHIAGKMDIIHWNNGLWDLQHYTDDRCLTPLPFYLDNIRRILGFLKKTGSSVIWATCTPVSDTHPRISNDELNLYNLEAIKIMKEEEIPINDLNQIIFADRSRYLAADGIHMNPEGVVACAEAVVRSILSI